VDARDIELLRTALKSVSPHYKGFITEAMLRNIDELCDMALDSLKCKKKSMKKKPRG
jgi:hypothetical protein